MGFWETVAATVIGGVLLGIVFWAWSKVKGAPRFVRSTVATAGALVSRFPLRVVRTGTLAHTPPPTVETTPTAQRTPYVDVPDAPQDGPYRAEKPKPKPLSLRQRCQRFANEIEEEVGRRDTMPLNERRGFDNYGGYIREVHSIQEDLLQHDYRKEAGALYRYAYADEWLSRTDMLFIAGVLRGIDWNKPPSGTVTVSRD